MLKPTLFINTILLLIIPIGYFLTFQYFSQYADQYLIYNIVFFLSLFIYLKFFEVKKKSNIFFGIILFVYIVAYFIKFYLIVYFSEEEILLSFLTLRSEIPFFTSDNLIKVYELITICFLSTTVMLYFLNKLTIKDKIFTYNVVLKNSKVKWQILAMILVIIFLPMFVKRFIPLADSTMAIFNVLDGFLSPMLLVILLYISILTNKKNYIKKAIFLLFGFAIVQYLFFASKMSIIFPSLILLFLYFEYKEKIINTKYILIGSLAFIAIYPLLNIYRVVSTYNQDKSILDILSMILSEFNNLSESVSPMTISLLSIIGRFTGADSLAVLMSAKGTNEYFNFGFIDSILSDETITQILTYNILGFKFTMGVETSIIGEIYFITGSIFLTLIILNSFILLIYLIAYRFLITVDNIYINGYYYYYLAIFFLIFNGGLIMKTFFFFLVGFLLMMVLSSIFLKTTRKIGS